MKQLGSYLGLVIGVIAVQMAASAAGKTFYLTQMTMAVYYSMVVLGLCLLMGFAGQVSLGHGAFFAIGGYVSAFGTTHHFASLQGSGWAPALQRFGLFTTRENLFDGAEIFSLTPWAAFSLAILVTLGIALVIGYPALRLKGHYLAMATLGFGLIIGRILIGNPYLGGADGITGVPPWPILPGLQVSGLSELRISNYYIAWSCAFLALVLLSNLVHSRFGRALRAIHEGETAANAMGVNTASLKLQAFVVSALLAAAAGCFMTHYNEGIGPSEASALKSVRYVALVAAGGMANLWGALLVSIVLNFLSLRGYFGTLDNAVFGALLILIVSLAPNGPLQPAGRWLRKLAGGLLRGKEARHETA